MQRLAIGDDIGFPHPAQVVGVRRHEILADALDHPGADLVGKLAGLDEVGQHRAFGVGEDHLGVGRDLLEIARQAGDGAAGADAADHGVDLVVELRPDLRAGGPIVSLRVGRVGELVDVEGAGLGGDALGHVLVVLGMALADVGAGEDHLRAQGLQVEDLLLGHLVRHHDDQPVALLRRHQRQAEAGVAGGRLDDRAARLQAAVGLGRLDHRHADAVLDRSRRVLALELEEQPAGPGVQSLDLHHRGVADGLEDVGEGGCRVGHSPIRVFFALATLAGP